ncbi:PucR family transcriptional regulator [Kribbella solani]|uniref:PucR family transcriptional regulator n=1 Tax=Kribbella solani TaxID=236067 RepID=A0A841DJM1_9ACTN|nr:helix-turn-helix domain-containing protein [Kribbella solani]MBB5977275.1 hypothetical protein [Kribbella solani]
MFVAEESGGPTLGRVIDYLGSTLLEVIAGRVRADAGMDRVVIHDPDAPPEVLERAIVLAVGVSGPAAVRDLVLAMAQGGATCVMARLPVDLDDAGRQAIEDSGVVLVGLARGASWAHIVVLLRSMLTVDDLAADAAVLPGDSQGDLFTLATAVSALLDAPVTIEDLNSNVLAFSANQDQADDSRKEGILGRRVPERYTRELAVRGVFRRVYSSAEPIYVEAFHEGDLSRVAVRVCAGDEVLGSMWAAVTEPLGPDRMRAFMDSSKLVALQLLRHRAGADVERRLRTDLVATLIEGGPRAREAAERLGLAGGSSCVLAFGLADLGDALGQETVLQKARAALSVHLAAVQPSSATALIGGILYGVLRVRGAGDTAERRVVDVAEEFLARLSNSDLMMVGIGRIADRPEEVSLAAGDAVRALRVIRSGQVAGRTARASDVAVQALLLDASGLAAHQHWQASRGLAALIAHDEARDSCLLDTLRAWLEAFGDVYAAAAAVHVHANTFRYRLRRVTEVSGLDFGDSEVRFATMVELRILALMNGQRGAIGRIEQGRAR